MLPELELLGASRPSVFYQRRNLYELDIRPYAIEVRYALQERIGEKVFGYLF